MIRFLKSARLRVVLLASVMTALLFTSTDASATLFSLLESCFGFFSLPTTDEAACVSCEVLKSSHRKTCTYNNGVSDFSEPYNCHTFTENGTCKVECSYNQWHCAGCQFNPSGCAIGLVAETCSFHTIETTCGTEITLPGF